MLEEPVSAAVAAEKTEPPLSDTPLRADLEPTPPDGEPWQSFVQQLADPCASVLDRATFLNLFLRRLTRQLGADIGLIYGWDKTAGEWVLFSRHGLRPDIGKGSAIPRAWQSLPSLVQQCGPSLFSDDISKDPRFVGQIIRGMGVQTFAGATLQSDLVLHGSLLLGFFVPSALTPEGVSLFLSAATLLPPYLPKDVSKRQQSPAQTSNAHTVLPRVRHDTTPRHAEMKADFLEFVVFNSERFATPEEACGGILTQALAWIGAQEGVVLQWDALQQRRVLTAQCGLPADDVERLSRHGVLSGDAALEDSKREAPPTETAPAPAEPDVAPPSGDDAEVHSAFTIEANVEIANAPSGPRLIWGTLALRRSGAPFSRDDRQAVLWVTKVLGETLGRFIRREAARQQTEEQDAVCNLTRALVGHFHLEPMLVVAAENLSCALGVAHCYFFCVDEKRGAIQGIAASPPHGAAIRDIAVALNATTLVALTARDKCPIVVENARQDARVDKKWTGLFRSRVILSVPLMVQQRVVGVLLLDEDRRFRKWGDEEIARVAALGVPIASALDHAVRHHGVAQHLARLQALTLEVVHLQETERRDTARKIQEALAEGDSGLRAVWKKRGKQQSEPPAVPDPSSTPEATDPQDTMRDGAWGADLEEVRAQTQKTHATLRKIADDLHPPLLDSMGLVPALRGWVDTLSKQTGLTVNLHASGVEKRLGPKMEALLYRLIQEALTNVARHAQAQSVLLSVEKKDAHLQAAVTDDGKGFDVRRHFSGGGRKGLGICWMREHVELSGGKLFIDSALGRGTRISISLPIPRKSAQPHAVFPPSKHAAAQKRNRRNGRSVPPGAAHGSPPRSTSTSV